MQGDLYITGDPEGDGLLNSDPLALLLGMLLDQQVAMETAFAGPHKIAERLGTLDPAAVADADPEAFAARLVSRTWARDCGSVTSAIERRAPSRP